MNIKERLFEMQDIKYAEFISKLTPNIDRKKFIGIRVPNLRAFAKEVIKAEEAKTFLENLPHDYYEENLLHSFLICEVKDFDECLEKLDKFLPYVDNWAVCDTMKPKVFKKNKAKLLPKLIEWINSDATYTSRFGIEILMNFYLDKDFKEEYLELPAKVETEEYYLNMMLAWYYATALAKQWDATIKYIEQKRLSRWVHNKTIQKAIESFRISDAQKEYLRTLRV